MKRNLNVIRLVPTCAVLALFLSGAGPAFGAGHGDHGMGGHASPMTHAHGKPLMVAPGPEAPALAITIVKDPVGGWNLHLQVTNFRFAPERASATHRAGEGHAHLYVNGKKIARIYGPWFHIGSLPHGKAVIKVTLNTNDHREIMVGAKPLAATKTLAVSPSKH